MNNLRQAAEQALKALETGLAFSTHSLILKNLRAALAEPVNFCPRCGKRAYQDTVHTCTPPNDTPR